jgi:predicted PurR-regulated permease PerM
MSSESNQREPSQSGNGLDQQRNRRLLILIEILAAIALVLVILWGISHIITSVLVVLIAALIAYAIVPVVELFQKVMPRALAILFAYLIVMIILGAVAYSVVNTAVFQISALVHNVTIWLTPDNKGKLPLLDLLHTLGLSDTQISDIEKQILGELSTLAGSFASGLIPLLSGVAGGLLNVLLTAVISIYLLVDGPRAITWLRKAAPRSRRNQMSSTLETLQRVVGGYIRGQILLSAIIGSLVGTGLFIINFPYAVLMGVLTFITEFIPVLGTIFAGVVAVILALTQGWVKAIIVLAFFILVHIFEGYVLAPRLIGKAVQINPAIMLIALIVGSELFGPIGAIFAAPTAGLLQALVIAIWYQYQQTHKEEFSDGEDEQEPTTKQSEEFPVIAAMPVLSASSEEHTKDE